MGLAKEDWTEEEKLEKVTKKLKLLLEEKKKELENRKAELKKKGIETRGLLEDADVADAYLAAEGRLSRYEASVRPRDPAIGGDAGTSDAASAPGSECVMLWGRCWQQLRYK